MKKLINLQLFAEDATADAAADAAATTEGEEVKKDETKKEEKKGAEGKDAPKYTNADVDKLIAKKFAEWQKKQQKAVDEAKKLAEMNATEKAEYERDKLKKELDELKRKDSLAEMTKTARKMLSDGGINVPDELLAMMVTTDAEETKTAIDGFAKIFKEAVENAVKERLKGSTPRKAAAGGVAAMTKEQIMAIPDAEARQKKMLENKHLFNF